jgi:hypothetical protein
MADLLKRLKGAHGDERVAILNEIKALNLLAFQASVTSGQIHDVIGLIGGAIGKTFGGGFGHKATGGPVRKGEPVIVGEDRPELFVPDENGTILPRVPSGWRSTDRRHLRPDRRHPGHRHPGDQSGDHHPARSAVRAVAQGARLEAGMSLGDLVASSTATDSTGAGR